MSDFPLEPDRATLERWLAQAARIAFDHVTTLDTQPAMGLLGAAGNRRAAEVSRPIPEDPIPGGMEAALEIVRSAAEAALLTPGPGYLAYVPGGGLPVAAIADFMADCFNRFTGLTAAAPGFTRLEADVLAWLAGEIGYASDARGLFTSGGSLSLLSAIACARESVLGESEGGPPTAYASTQVHHSVRKCFKLLGLPRALVELPPDDRLRLDPRALAERMDRDREAGRRPFMVIASAGTTNTGAIDPLDALADACASRGAWLHADGAYGAAFVLCDEGRRRLAGIGRCDSVTLDPHKGMFLPYGTGCLLVRDGEKLRRAHSEGASYLQDFEAWDRTGEAPSPSDHGPELSRDFRGLRPWLALMVHGARAFRDALTEKLALAAQLHAGLVRVRDSGLPLEVLPAPALSIVTFRAARRPGEPLASWNARSARLLAAVNAPRRVVLSSTTLPVEDGAAFTLRACVLSFRTHAPNVAACLEDVESAVREG